MTQMPFDLPTDLEPATALSRELAGAEVGGLDEAGRGPLAGPVVAACVVLGEEIAGLNDSKKLSEKKREALYEIIYDKALAVGVGVAEAEEIDDKNILNASLDAMCTAFLAAEHALGHQVKGAIVDGDKRAPLPERVRQRTVIGGDRICPAVMAASIVAKVTRDRRMKEEALRYPGYGFEKHKGYPTKAHREALMKLGPTPIHRYSFAPVRLAAGK